MPWCRSLSLSLLCCRMLPEDGPSIDPGEPQVCSYGWLAQPPESRGKGLDRRWMTAAGARSLYLPLTLSQFSSVLAPAIRVLVLNPLKCSSPLYSDATKN